MFFNPTIWYKTACYLSAFGMLIVGFTGASSAESPAVFLKSLSGTWRGTGTIYISEKSKKSRVRCKITSTLNKAKRKLVNKGRCATTQRKSRISGSISYFASGNKLSGSYFNALGDYRVTKSSGSVTGTTLTLHTTFENRSISEISRTRNVVKRISKRKFKVTIFERVKGSYKRRGTIVFTK